MTTRRAAQLLGQACAVLVAADKLDPVAAISVICSTPPCSPERDAALDAYNLHSRKEVDA